MKASQDWIQIPRPDFDDKLSACIAAGDCQQARNLFDQAFWDRYKIFLTWDHLKTAVLREDKPMLKLLVTWGAEATDEEMTWFRSQAKDKYPHYIALLRQAGLQLSAAALKEIPYMEVQPLTPEDMIPQEWKQVLQAFQREGALEATIAGITLRDLFNERGSIRAVDVFLRSSDVKGPNQRLLYSVFREAGLEITGQQGKPGADPELFPSPKMEISLLWANHQHLSEIWTVVAGPHKTRYNIVFDKGGYDIFWPPKGFAGNLIRRFSFGLDQIAYDGKQIITTPFYDFDVKNKQITLRNLRDTSREHLQALVKKYPDWKLCPESKKLLEPPKPPLHWYAAQNGCSS